MKNTLKTLMILLLVGLLAACKSPGASTAQIQAAQTPAQAATQAPTLAPALPTATTPASSTPLPTATYTQSPPTLTPTVVLPSETATMQPSPTLTVTAAATSSGSASVGGSGGLKVYLVVKSVGGVKGCNDTVVPVSTGVPLTKDTAKNIENALDTLFSMKNKYYGSLYNPVSYSTFRVQQIDWSNTTGHLNVWLSGKYNPTDDVCDNTRVKAQIWSTAKQFGVTTTNFYINGPHPFGDFVSNDK